MSVVLEVRGLRKIYGPITALEGLDLDVHAGEVLGLLGPNGAGKTTFTKCVTGFVKPAAGKIRVNGIDPVATPERAARHIGLVPDQYDLYPLLTGREHLDLYGRLHGIEGEPLRARVQEVVELVGMTERADTRTKSYSHGMKQRICIGQALLHKPDLVFFDEPTNGLDPKGAYELRQMIRSLAKEGIAVVLNSHLLNEVQETCHRVAVLDKGVLLDVAPVNELRSRYATGHVRMRMMNPTKKVLAAIAAVSSTPAVDGENVLVQAAETQVPDIVTAAAKAGARILEVEPSRASLEDVFLRITEGA